MHDRQGVIARPPQQRLNLNTQADDHIFVRSTGTVMTTRNTKRVIQDMAHMVGVLEPEKYSESSLYIKQLTVFSKCAPKVTFPPAVAFALWTADAHRKDRPTPPVGICTLLYGTVQQHIEGQKWPENSRRYCAKLISRHAHFQPILINRQRHSNDVV